MQTIGSTIRTECFAATRAQQGRTQNEDAFLIGRGERPFAALCDGAGNAERAAKRVLALFEKLLNEATAEQIMEAETWAKWVKLLDSSLVGGAQSTFLTVAIVGGEAVGVCAGDSRLYHLNRDGQCHIVTDGAGKQRLGSGQAQPFAIRLTLGPGDILLLLSDGAWTPINLYLLQKTVVSAAVKHFSDVPAAIRGGSCGQGGRHERVSVEAGALGHVAVVSGRKECPYPKLPYLHPRTEMNCSQRWVISSEGTKIH
jgi:serine/threonine protein phosphatase PrpC